MHFNVNQINLRFKYCAQTCIHFFFFLPEWNASTKSSIDTASLLPIKHDNNSLCIITPCGNNKEAREAIHLSPRW